jgi:hypothetical protein
LGSFLLAFFLLSQFGLLFFLNYDFSELFLDTSLNTTEVRDSTSVLADKLFSSSDGLFRLECNELEETFALFIRLGTERVTEVAPQSVLGSSNALIPGVSIFYLEAKVSSSAVSLLEGSWDSVAILIT